MRRPPVESRRKRIMWDNDNARVDGRTSIRVLLDWITMPENYDRWCGSKARGGGETREQLCTEIREEMEEEGLFHRENANIRTQINELERSYATAVAWLGANGFDVRDSNLNTAEAGRHVLKMCRYFHDLHHVMYERQELLGPGRANSPTIAVRDKPDAEYTSEAQREDSIQPSRAIDEQLEPTQARSASLPASRQQRTPERSEERQSVYFPSSGLRSWQGSHPVPRVPYHLSGHPSGRSVPWRAELAPRSTHSESKAVKKARVGVGSVFKWRKRGTIWSAKDYGTR